MTIKIYFIRKQFKKNVSDCLAIRIDNLVIKSVWPKTNMSKIGIS